MKKGYSYYISAILTGVLVLSFTFAIDSLDKNRITFKSNVVNTIKLDQIISSLQDEGSRDICDESFMANEGS